MAVEVSAEDVRENTTRLRFSVSDTGIGMSAEQVSKLFQSFNQADASHTRNLGVRDWALPLASSFAI